jgi:hypothetical protein
MPGERQGLKEGERPPLKAKTRKKGAKKHCFTVTHLNPCIEVECGVGRPIFTVELAYMGVLESSKYRVHKVPERMCSS